MNKCALVVLCAKHPIFDLDEHDSIAVALEH